MRKRSLGLIAAFSLTLVFAGTAFAGNILRVREIITPQESKLAVRFHIQNPAGCPAREPNLGSDAYEVWLSDRCTPYVYQQADVVLRVYHGGRVVYSDSQEAAAGIGDPQTGGTWDVSVSTFDLENQLGRCAPGQYFWRVTLIDPYGRSEYNMSRRGSFIVRCR